MSYLAIQDLKVTVRGKPVLDGLSMQISEKEIVGLIGPPGCGKSTLLNAIFGLARLDSGTIVYGERRIGNRSPRTNLADGVVLVPQGGRVFRSLSVAENLELAGFNLRDETLLRQRIRRVHEFFPRLQERLHQTAGSLSGGERQMLALGIGLVAGPRLFLLDEPSTGLSPLLTDRILGEIRNMVRDLGCSVLMVEQNVRNAALVSDRVLVMRRGAIGYEHIVDGTQDTRALLDAYAFERAGADGTARHEPGDNVNA